MSLMWNDVAALMPRTFLEMLMVAFNCIFSLAECQEFSV